LINPLSIPLYFLVFIVAFCSSFLLTPLLIVIAKHLKILDIPSESHKAHDKPIPYLGGLAILVPFLLALFTYLLHFESGPGVKEQIISLGLSAFCISSIGLIDDVKLISARIKLALQLTISTPMVLFLIESGFAVQLSGIKLLDVLLSLMWLVAIINCINFVDNIDGGAAGLVLISCIPILTLSIIGGQFLISTLSLFIAASTAAFLFWNLSPARIYLGDSGSLFLGLLMGILTLSLDSQTGSRTTSLLTPILILGLPIVDALVAIFGRLYRREPIMLGNRDHLSHRLIGKGCSKQKSVTILWCLQALSSSLAIVINVTTSLGVLRILEFTSCVYLGLVTVFFLRHSPQSPV